MRNLDTPVKQIRRKIFTEIAKIGFESTDESMIHDIESIPYNIVEERAKYRESIYRERAVASERVRLAMGLSLRPENRSVHLTDGVKASNIDEKYYEPPLMQVIPSACSACESNKYEVSNMCRGCVAHPCLLTCPKGAISMVNGKSFIDQDKCIHCGRCKAVCPYDAIAHKERPCERACGVKAIESDEQGRASINQDKCVSCGMCMVSCPFGAISDKSQIFQLAHALREGTEIIAEIAPAYINQFGEDVTPGQFRSALKQLGFSNIYEVALGADIGCISEAHHYAKEVATGHLPFLLTSCCPSWSVMAKKYFPAMIDNISQELTPMVATARIVKKEHPHAKVVFIGPVRRQKHHPIHLRRAPGRNPGRNRSRTRLRHCRRRSRSHRKLSEGILSRCTSPHRTRRKPCRMQKSPHSGKSRQDQKLHDRRNGLPRRLHRRRRNQRRLRKNLQGPQKIRRQLRTKTPLTGTGKPGVELTTSKYSTI